jgi:phenylacetate-CoA ligase
MYYPVAWFQAGNVARHLKESQFTQFSSETARTAHHLERINFILSQAKINCAFYSRHYEGIDPPLASLSEFRNIPLVLKGHIQKDGPRFRSSASLGRLVTKTSGGSTGQPVEIFKTRDAWAKELAVAWRGFEWAGVGIGDRQARFWGVPLINKDRVRSKLVDIACNRIRLSAFEFTEENLHHYFKQVNEFRPEYFYGYVSMLTEFAAFVDSHDLTLEHPLKCIISTSEVLTRHARELLERVFSTRVFNEYGCGELGTIAHECEYGQLHLNEENLFVEILDGAKTCPDGISGEIVVTELNNLAMPLIRYRTGDFGVLSDKPCSCGRTLKVLKSVQGRAYDMIKTGDGRIFHGEIMMYIFEDIRRSGVGIKQFQVEQVDLENILVRIVPGLDFQDSTKETIQTQIRQNIDPAIRVRFQMVKEIPREKSGKLRLIIGLDAPRR